MNRPLIRVDLGLFTDPGDDGPWQVTVDWGDGSSDAFVAGAPKPLGSRNHTYATGLSWVSLTVEWGFAHADPMSGAQFDPDSCPSQPCLIRC